MRAKLNSALVAMVLTGIAAGANADMVSPLQAKPIELGSYHGVVYFEQTPRGWEVVTTVATVEASENAAMRYVATLQEGQSQTLIVGGAEPFAVELARTGRGLAVSVVKPAAVVSR